MDVGPGSYRRSLCNIRDWDSDIKNPNLSEYPSVQEYIDACQFKHDAVITAVPPGTKSALVTLDILGTRLLQGLPHADRVDCPPACLPCSPRTNRQRHQPPHF